MGMPDQRWQVLENQAKAHEQGGVCRLMLRLSDEQILRARSIDLLTYLQTHEPRSVRKSHSGEYYLAEHDSLKISNGKWYRHSTQQGGVSALDFLVKVRGVHFVDAVQSLIGGNALADYKAITKLPPQPTKPKLFKLPKPNRNNDRVVAYLRERGINKGVIYGCIKTGLLYESDKHRCVFVGKDENGVARYACERGVSDDLKKDVAGSSKKFGFTLQPIVIDGLGNSVLALFESPIDSLAHASIHHTGLTDWDGHRLSLGGVSSAALHGFLDRNPQINIIQLCLDNDTAGCVASNRIIKELLTDKQYSHMKIAVTPAPIGNDYADTAMAISTNCINKSTINRPKGAAFL